MRVAVLDQLCKGAVLSVPVECVLLGVLVVRALHCSGSVLGGRKVFEARAIELLNCRGCEHASFAACWDLPLVRELRGELFHVPLFLSELLSDTHCAQNCLFMSSSKCA